MVKSELTSVSTRFLLTGAQLVIVSAAIFFLVRAIIVFVTPEVMWKSVDISPSTSPVTKSNTTSLAPEYDPFHRDSIAQPEFVGEDAPETTLNLKLLGLRAGDAGTAILETPDRKQGVYGIGDEIISGVTLKTVSPGFIVLSLNGRLERLTFERQGSRTLLNPSIQDNLSLTTPEQNPIPRLSTSLASLMAGANLERVADGSRTKGFRISARHSQVSLEDYNLRTGDILTRIGTEDLSVGRPDFADLFTELNTRQSVDVTLIRDGKTMTVKVGK